MSKIYSAYKQGSSVYLLDERGNTFKAISTFDDSELVGYTQSAVSIKDSNGSIRVINCDGDEIGHINPVYDEPDEDFDTGNQKSGEVSWESWVAFAVTVGLGIFYYNVVTWISHTLRVETGAACLIALFGTIIVTIFLAFIGLFLYNRLKK